ncbi:unnamed protein product [Rotaria sordida]|uniref:Cytochrome P450 n=1 Tax=Rotaria sordida TaxID=392033 RepID=A0A815HWC1_9BILA|nr:unnamed protein product [Rotaria sordida]
MGYCLIFDSLSLTLLVIVAILFACYVYNLRKNNLFRRLGIPGPSPIPLLGNLLNIIRKGLYLNDIEMVQKYGNIFGTFEGTIPVIILSDPELLRKVLIKDFHVFTNRRILKGLTGPLEHGLTMLRDDAWKNARTIVSPTFSSAKLKAMHSLIDQIGDGYSKRLLEYADKQEMFDVKLINSQYTLDNIASSLIYLISPRLTSYLGSKGYTLLPTDSMNYLTLLVNEVLDRRRHRIERRNDFVQNMIDHEEEIHNEEIKEQSNENIQQWSSLKKTLSDREILGQALIFLMAGYETTSTLLSFFFYVMAIYPDIQEKIYAEIQQQLGSDEITYDKIHQLVYLDMVINETLRMYPPVLRLERIASTSYDLGEYHIPKGSIIGVPIYAIHHDPAFWSDPEEFIPERFSSTDGGKRYSMIYLPFGDGPR